MEEIFKQEGWTLNRLNRRERTYIYALRRQGGKFSKHLYIGPETRVLSWSPDELRDKLRAS